MLPHSRLHLDLRSSFEAMARQPLLELLEQHGLLQTLARDLALKSLREEARFTEEERQAVLARVCAGLPCTPPSSLEGDWIATLPENLRDTVRQRWNHLRHQKALADRYGDRVEAHFLERRADLEQVVFRLLRLPQQGLAEELYLRLVDDGAGFGDLASRYSLGDESVTRGIVGPIERSQLHPTLRGVLGTLAVGDIHPPFLLDQAVLLVRLEHRRPASLTEDLRHRLLEELLQPDLQSCIEAALAELRRSLAAEQGPLAPVPAPALAVAGG
ncbi:peptidyl-prolyl cis-trans isomerase [Synechococcus sp. CCY 0621]|uniref:peptidylprolyl isomerase n=1 Tax=Synechococcus sp. CCY 0621 TaxID=2815603 RepID=UPI001C23CC4C|nr:peptidyl-prolyl cis-trans isomerase [Synechococcus sp. CCY 0621]